MIKADQVPAAPWMGKLLVLYSMYFDQDPVVVGL